MADLLASDVAAMQWLADDWEETHARTGCAFNGPLTW
jgi:hypothetical protein